MRLRSAHLLTILLLLVAVAATGCFGFGKKKTTTNPDGTTKTVEVKNEETSNNADGTRAYRNITDGYKVTLPKNWRADNGRIYSPTMYDKRTEDGPYSLLILTNSPYPTVEAYLEEQQKCIVNAVPIHVGEINAMRYINPCTSPNPNPIMTVLVANNQLIVAVSYSPTDELPVIDQILASLEFTK